FGDGPQPCVSLEVLRRLPALLEHGRPLRLTVFDDEVLGIEDAGKRGQLALGVAIDVGTTTVVVRLLDLVTGEQLALAGTRNKQASQGANVISRIALGSTPRGLDLLQELVVKKTILPLIEKCMAQANLHGVPIRRAAVGGNTCMVHLLLGLSPKGLGTVPFNAVSLAPAPVPGAALGLPVERVECIPAAGGYIGGDVVGGMYVVGLDREGPPEMLIDVGTNSEILLRVGGQLYGASAAAGPAFEGGGLASGGPATANAIAHLRYTGKGFTHETCGKAAPTHVCGSAYVDFLAEGRKHGFLLEHGRFAPEFPYAEQFKQPAENGQKARVGRRCHVAKGVTIDDHDVSLLLQAKAATLAGALILLRKAGVTPQDLHALHVAGGFGRHLDPAHALRIGLLPPVPLERIKVAGNTSLAAASSTLLNAHATQEIRALARRVQVVELNLEPDFQDCFINALSMP
ncbi:MAG: ASKHA domain-containing protein, partial [Planctomycetota bacterium]|nr:ASKHA domain-containing protein [Planctomycetota bacterium]